MKLKLTATALTMFITACSSQTWYEGVKQNALQHCEKIVDSTERNRCIQQQPSYQNYQQQRQELNENK